MRFSAEASFAMSATLLAAGTYCVAAAVRKNRSLLSIAAIPWFFGAQQAAEGLVWTGLGSGDVGQTRVAALVFLFFALAFWPFWIPFCAFLTKSAGDGKTFYALVSSVGLGAGLGIYVPLALQGHAPIAEVASHSIHYDVASSAVFRYVPLVAWELLYVVIVCSPIFLSKDTKFLFLGLALVLSAAMSYFLFWYTFASVWCFFAAGLSIYLCVIFRKLSAAVPL